MCLDKTNVNLQNFSSITPSQLGYAETTKKQIQNQISATENTNLSRTSLNFDTEMLNLTKLRHFDPQKQTCSEKCQKAKIPYYFSHQSQRILDEKVPVKNQSPPTVYRTLPRTNYQLKVNGNLRTGYRQKLDSEVFSSSMGTLPKRVQFANIPSRRSSSSDCDLSDCVHGKSKSNRKYHRPRSSPSCSGERSKTDRRSSSVSNFMRDSNTSKHRYRHSGRSVDDYIVKMNRSNIGRSSFGQAWSKSVHENIESTSDFDQSTCSTSSSYDSASDVDEYKCYFHEYNSFKTDHNRKRPKKLPLNQQRQYFNKTTNSDSLAESSVSTRSFYSGFKISYVDSLPLARTNPVYGDSNGNNKKTKQKHVDKPKKVNPISADKNSSKLKINNCFVS